MKDRLLLLIGIKRRAKVRLKNKYEFMSFSLLIGWGGECVTPVLVRSLKLSTLVHSQ